MRLLFIMDPVSQIIPDEDTSFALMLEAHGRGHRVEHCLHSDVRMEGGAVHAHVRRATPSRAAAAAVGLGDVEDVALGQLDAIFVRKDPPFDRDYLWLSLLLDHVVGQTTVVNAPGGLRAANEKLYATHFADLCPRTCVTANANRIRSFVDEVGGKAVIKPVDGHGGQGVFLLEHDSGNMNALIEHLTDEGKRLAMVQRFIPEVTEGDKRILVLDGKPLGAVVRVPRKGDLRSNVHVGGTVHAAHLDDDDRRIVETMAPRLRKDGLWFVGLDVIGGLLTEVNVTSPTCIQQMSRLSGTNCEAPVIDWVERRAG